MITIIATTANVLEIASAFLKNAFLLINDGSKGALSSGAYL